MRTRRLRDALVGVVYLLVIAALIALSIMIYNHDFTRYVDVSLRTDHVGSALQKGSDVKVRGVLVGEVSAVTTNGTGADVHLQLDPGKVAALPANMTAQLLPKTVFGERFVGLIFPARPSPQKLHSGDTIEQDRSAQSIELEQLFSDLLPVLQAVQPAQLAATLTQIATALRGRGADLASTLDIVGRYLAKLAPQASQIGSDLGALAQVARTYTQAAPDLISALDSMSTTSQTIASHHAQLTQLLASLTQVSNSSRELVSQSQQAIIGLSRDSRPTLQVLAHYSSEFPCISQALVNYIPRANHAFGVGTDQPGAHVILHVVPPSRSYTSADLPHNDSSQPPPRCPYTPAASLSATALTTSGMGTANSPAENAFINELLAASTGQAPAGLPQWSSLLLGPALRGAQVSVR